MKNRIQVGGSEAESAPQTHATTEQLDGKLTNPRDERCVELNRREVLIKDLNTRHSQWR